MFRDMFWRYDFDGEFGYTENGNSIHPATEEQRELLFQKMKEEGYEWDAEKKELKKIEQTPTEWSEEDETIKKNISHIISQYDKISKRNNQPCWYVGDCLLWMQNIKDRVQPKPKWKPSDEQIECLSKHIEYERRWNSSHALDVLSELLEQLKKL